MENQPGLIEGRNGRGVDREKCYVSNCEFLQLDACCGRSQGRSFGEVTFKYCFAFEFLLYFSHLLCIKKQECLCIVSHCNWWWFWFHVFEMQNLGPGFGFVMREKEHTWLHSCFFFFFPFIWFVTHENTSLSISTTLINKCSCKR